MVYCIWPGNKIRTICLFLRTVETITQCIHSNHKSHHNNSHSLSPAALKCSLPLSSSRCDEWSDPRLWVLKQWSIKWITSAFWTELLQHVPFPWMRQVFQLQGRTSSRQLKIKPGVTKMHTSLVDRLSSWMSETGHEISTTVSKLIRDLGMPTTCKPHYSSIQEIQLAMPPAVLQFSTTIHVQTLLYLHESLTQWNWIAVS